MLAIFYVYNNNNNNEYFSREFKIESNRKNIIL